MFTGNTSEECITGFIRCEQEWLRQFAKPRLPTDPFYRSAEENDPKNHIRLLDYCLEALRTYEPSTDFCSPVLWHPDLERANIFVTDHAPYALTSVFDWQYAGISPFFTQKMLPDAFSYVGGRVMYVPGVADLPSNFEELSEEEKQLTLDHRFDAGMRALYEDIMKRNTPQHMLQTSRAHRILMRPYFLRKGTWLHGLGRLQWALAQLQHEWQALGPSENQCPFHFSDEEIKRIIADAERVSIWEEEAANVQDMLKLHGDGWVPNELYDVTAAKNKEFREKY